MDDDPVLVPPEVADELDRLYGTAETAPDDRERAVDPDDRKRAVRRARERDLEAAAKWLEQVDDSVYGRSVRDGFVTSEKA